MHQRPLWLTSDLWRRLGPGWRAASAARNGSSWPPRAGRLCPCASAHGDPSTCLRSWSPGCVLARPTERPGSTCGGGAAMTTQGQWRRVGRAQSCPVCGKPDWCAVRGDGAAVIPALGSQSAGDVGVEYPSRHAGRPQSPTGLSRHGTPPAGMRSTAGERSLSLGWTSKDIMTEQQGKINPMAHPLAWNRNARPSSSPLTDGSPKVSTAPTSAARAGNTTWLSTARPKAGTVTTASRSRRRKSAC
jgi:hypothetical protein